MRRVPASRDHAPRRESLHRRARAIPHRCDGGPCRRVLLTFNGSDAGLLSRRMFACGSTHREVVDPGRSPVVRTVRASMPSRDKGNACLKSAVGRFCRRSATLAAGGAVFGNGAVQTVLNHAGRPRGRLFDARASATGRSAPVADQNGDEILALPAGFTYVTFSRTGSPMAGSTRPRARPPRRDGGLPRTPTHRAARSQP